jgi:hypothetical protein
MLPRRNGARLVTAYHRFGAWMSAFRLRGGRRAGIASAPSDRISTLSRRIRIQRSR